MRVGTRSVASHWYFFDPHVCCKQLLHRDAMVAATTLALVLRLATRIFYSPVLLGLLVALVCCSMPSLFYRDALNGVRPGYERRSRSVASHPVDRYVPSLL